MTSVSGALSALVLIAATACADDAPRPPTVLSDGSAARPPPVVLEDVEGPTILTRARVLRRDSVEPGSRTERCIDAARASGVVVERVSVSGTSVTFLAPGSRAVHGCDASPAHAREGSPWCGHAYGRLVAGCLRDPRLSVTCSGDDGEPLGFAWIQPGVAASYVVVGRRGYSEVYPVTGDTPVRIVTDDVDRDSASGTFSVSEHARDGRQLSAYEVEARTSG